MFPQGFLNFLTVAMMNDLSGFSRLIAMVQSVRAVVSQRSEA